MILTILPTAITFPDADKAWGRDSVDTCGWLIDRLQQKGLPDCQLP
jgi:hypothetical protein